MHTASGIEGPLSHQDSDLAIPGGRPLRTGSAHSPTGAGSWGWGMEDGQRQRNMVTENTDLRGKLTLGQATCFSVRFMGPQGIPMQHSAQGSPAAPHCQGARESSGHLGTEADWCRQGSRKPQSWPVKEASDWLCLPEGLCVG